MNNARRICFIALCCALCACGGPSLRYKKDVSALMASGNYGAAEAKIQKNKSKVYGQHNAALYALDLSIPQTALYKNKEANQTLQSAQDEIDYLQTKSVTQNLGTLIINDNTRPYLPSMFEQALTYFYRGLNYMSQGDAQDAAVEARKAAFFLDYNRSRQSAEYNDEPFVQYFASLIFEDAGDISDARICRENAQNAYKKYLSWYGAKAPDFTLPDGYQNMGEVIIFHLNGKAPFKISNEISLAWNNLWFAVNGNSDLNDVPGDVINAVYAGAFGNSVTVAFPKLEVNPYKIAYSTVQAFGQAPVKTQFVGDISASAAKTLEEQNAAVYARAVTRAVTKYILSVQARHTTQKLTGNKDLADIAGRLFSILSNITEKADTRSWFTLPAQIRMADIFLPQGTHDIKMVFYDDNNNPVDEYVFEKVQITKGKRIYLYRTTAK